MSQYEGLQQNQIKEVDQREVKAVLLITAGLFSETVRIRLIRIQLSLFLFDLIYLEEHGVA